MCDTERKVIDFRSRSYAIAKLQASLEKTTIVDVIEKAIENYANDLVLNLVNSEYGEWEERGKNGRKPLSKRNKNKVNTDIDSSNTDIDNSNIDNTDEVNTDIDNSNIDNTNEVNTDIDNSNTDNTNEVITDINNSNTNNTNEVNTDIDSSNTDNIDEVNTDIDNSNTDKKILDLLDFYSNI
jgi:hypothetical protein